MIRLQHVNKYFNRKKSNELHVINDTSLELGDKGVVALLGPSGCGKTTLLNAIGGLDKVDGGVIDIDGERLTKRSSGAIDEIRALNIGYIFQNYNLVDELTVFDNVAMVLKMTGVRSQTEIRAKVNYALETVGMYRYRNRYADMLSGGERQRVGIARALVKDPPVVIADEPTGNLDSKNTLAVMNIIKAISRSRLVILVTHEEELANFYADRIIRINDGKVVSDEINEERDDLDYRVDNNLYLQDMPNHEHWQTESGAVDLYSDGEETSNIRIVVKNGNVYIQTEDQRYRTEVINNDSGIRLIDGKYKEMSEADFFKNRFNPRKLKRTGVSRYTSIISFKEMLVNGFKKVTNYSVLKKILLVGFLISAMFIMYGLSNIAGVVHIDDSKFVKVNNNYLKIVGKNIKASDYKMYEQIDGVKYLVPGNSKVNFMIAFDDFYQTSTQSGALSGSLTSIKDIDKYDLVRGRMPKNKQEIVIDKLTADRLISGNANEMGGFDSGAAKNAGIFSAQDVLGRKAKINGVGNFTIVGMTDKVNPCIYADPSMFLQIVAGSASSDEVDMMGGDMIGGEEDFSDGDPSSAKLMDYNNFNFKGGVKPKKNYEVVVSKEYSDDMPLNKTIDRKVGGHKLKVVGYYEAKNGESFMLVNKNTMEESVIGSKSGVSVCTDDKEYVKQQLQDLGLTVEDPYEKARKSFVNDRSEQVRSALILALVVVLISIIEIFLIMRASFLSRIKEVGVFRAIGVKKQDIRKMFLGEILAVTVIADLPGYAFMCYIVSKLQNMVYLSQNFKLTPIVLIGGLIMIFAVNIIFGMLPVQRLLKKTPAAILARTDTTGR